MVPGTLDAGTVDGKLYGVLVSMNVKSLVFYPKKAWDKAGYKAPDSLGALTSLGDQIKKDGTPPWCFAVGSDAATGWPATDWFEDLIMQQSGPDVYKDWVTHKVKFDSGPVRDAADYFAKTMFTGGNVAGGRNSIASTAFGDADNPMWDAKPGCMMLKQVTSSCPRTSCPRTSWPTSTRTSGCLASRPPPPAATTRRWVVATWPPC